MDRPGCYLIRTSRGNLMACNHSPRECPDSTTAHRLMQAYIDCDARECPAKGPAFRWLTQHGEVTPDRRSEEYAL